MTIMYRAYWVDGKWRLVLGSRTCHFVVFSAKTLDTVLDWVYTEDDEA